MLCAIKKICNVCYLMHLENNIKLTIKPNALRFLYFIIIMWKGWNGEDLIIKARKTWRDCNPRNKLVRLEEFTYKNITILPVMIIEKVKVRKIHTSILTHGFWVETPNILLKKYEGVKLRESSFIVYDIRNLYCRLVRLDQFVANIQRQRRKDRQARHRTTPSLSALSA